MMCTGLKNGAPIFDSGVCDCVHSFKVVGQGLGQEGHAFVLILRANEIYLHCRLFLASSAPQVSGSGSGNAYVKLAKVTNQKNMHNCKYLLWCKCNVHEIKYRPVSLPLSLFLLLKNNRDQCGISSNVYLWVIILESSSVCNLYPNNKWL